jgi:ABC-type sugar transport system ATPase subunit/ribose/xylose/arabinose/galactoside ABC-type transport system permease subunit
LRGTKLGPPQWPFRPEDHLADEAATKAPLLRLSNVWKSFPGVDALKNVSFAAAPGEVHALLGENGAGKSTLMAVASGAITPDAGEIELGRESFDSLQAAEAQRLGLAIVRQDPALFPELTVAENMAIAAPAGVATTGAEARKWMVSELERVGCQVKLNARVEELTVAQRQLIELAKALALEPRVLILDEPTAPLGADMVDQVFAQVRGATARNAAVVYISHRLREVRRVADRVTVMRDGEIRGSAPVGEMSDEEMLRLIVGRKLSLAFPTKNGSQNGHAPALTVAQMTGKGFRDVNLSVSSNEILGLAGIAGNGQAEFLRALAGLERASGEVRLGEQRLKLGRVGLAHEAGVVYLPADRHGEGLITSLSVRENAALSALPDFASHGVLNRRQEMAAVARQRDALDVRTPSLGTQVTALSGGNQQKVALARALLSNPSLVLADEPTQGVDAGARVELYRNLREIADSGVPVIVVSSDNLELEGLCDRVVVFSRGQVVGELTNDQVSEEEITRAMITANTHRADDARPERPPREASANGSRPSIGSRIRSFSKGDYAPSLVLLIIILALGVYTYAENDRVLSSFNVTSVLLLLSALAFISFGQLVVILTAGIDLSVGPLAGLLVVISSFFVLDEKSTAVIVAGFGVMLAAAVLTGAVNGGLVRFARFTPIAATLATYVALQGISLLLRPEQGGFISGDITTAIQAKVGTIPIAFLVAVALALLLEYGLRRTRWGLTLRAVGSDDDAAHRLGVRTTRTLLGAYVLCSVLTFLGAIMLMAQLGVGDPNQGVTYTLSSITAVVLGGASLFGGRGSFIGALLGAALIQQTINATTFLSLGQSWQYWIMGLLVLLAAGIYTQARQTGQRA